MGGMGCIGEGMLKVADCIGEKPLGAKGRAGGWPIGWKDAITCPAGLIDIGLGAKFPFGVSGGGLATDGGNEGDAAGGA